MEALCCFSQAAAVDSILLLLPFSNDHKLRLNPAFCRILISLLVSELILIFGVLLPPILHLSLYLRDFCNIFGGERLILKKSAQGYVLIAHFPRLLFGVIEYIQLNCKIILKNFTVPSIFLAHNVDLRKGTLWALVDLINAAGVLLEVVSHHFLAEQLEASIIIIDHEQLWLFVVERQRFLFTVFLLLLKSIARLTIFEVLCFSWSNFNLLVVEATRNFVAGEVETNLFGVVEFEDIEILFIYPQQVPIFKLNDRSIAAGTTCDSNDDFISHHAEIALLTGNKGFALLLNPHSVPLDLILRALEKANPLGRLLCILRLVDYDSAVLSFDNLCFFNLSLKRVRGVKSSLFQSISQLVYVGSFAVCNTATWV